MKTLDKIDYMDAPEFIKDQIDRELYDEDEREYSKIKRGQITLELLEFDPKNKKDREILEDHLKSKINDEGDPDWAAVDAIGNDGVINDPILITTGTCREGRHRLAASLKYNLKIKAYVD